MRFHDRGEAVQFASQSRQILRRSQLPFCSQSPNLPHDHGYRGVVAGQLPDRGRQVWPGAEQVGEDAVVFACMVRRQG
jgi:hypothetical protein